MLSTIDNDYIESIPSAGLYAKFIQDDSNDGLIISLIVFEDIVKLNKDDPIVLLPIPQDSNGNPITLLPIPPVSNDIPIILLPMPLGINDDSITLLTTYPNPIQEASTTSIGVLEQSFSDVLY